MTNSRFSRDTKSFISFDFKNEIFKRELERSKKIIKDKASINSRSSRRRSDEIETESNSQRFVVESMSSIISAFFVTFVSTSFVTVVSISSVTIVFASSVTLSFVSASLDESIVNSIFEEMNRDVLIRLLTILISFSTDLFLEFTSAFVADSISIRTTISIQITVLVIDSVVTSDSKSVFEEDFKDLDDVLDREKRRR
jgi:hypothetical protein